MLRAMHSWIFYPLVALAAGALILLSLGPRALPKQHAPQTGHSADGAVAFDAVALANVAPADNIVLYTPYSDGRPTALRIATMPSHGPPRPDEAGARLPIEPASLAPFMGRAIEIELDYRPLIESTAPSLALALSDGGPLQWVEIATVLEPATLKAVLPPAHGPVSAIAIRPINPNPQLNFGVEISRLTVRPAP
jgi:hypothetical protein